MPHYLKVLMKTKQLLLILLFCLSLGLVNCWPQSPPPAVTDSGTTQPITIWWTKGFYPAEDEALSRVVRQWERQINQPVELTFYDDDENLQRVLNALAEGTPPDIAYNRRAEFAVNPRVAWEGKVPDLSEVIQPVENLYTESAVKSAYLLNKTTGERSYYGVPLQQQTVHLHYWGDLLEEAGFTPEDIPKNWEDFWAFWQQAQDNLRAKGYENIYGVGLTVSPMSNDTFYEFEHFLEAYDVSLLDSEGNPRVSDPELRQNLVRLIEWIVGFYQEGYIHPDAVNWGVPDNNTAFLNRQLLMVFNPTLSIPSSQQTDPEVAQTIVTHPLPNEPDGEVAKTLISVKQVLTFTDSPHPEAAKDFLRYLSTPENLSLYLQDSGGRYFPVMKPLLEEPFWSESTNPHIAVAAEQFKEVRPLEYITSPPYSQIFAENLWGRALRRVAVDGVSATVAVEETLARIEEIFREWGDS